MRAADVEALVPPPPASWQAAADEIRAEARARGDLDERTVNALVVRLERLDHSFMRTHAEVERIDRGDTR